MLITRSVFSDSLPTRRRNSTSSIPFTEMDGSEPEHQRERSPQRISSPVSVGSQGRSHSSSALSTTDMLPADRGMPNGQWWFLLLLWCYIIYLFIYLFICLFIYLFIERERENLLHFLRVVILDLINSCLEVSCVCSLPAVRCNVLFLAWYSSFFWVSRCRLFHGDNSFWTSYFGIFLTETMKCLEGRAIYNATLSLYSTLFNSFTILLTIPLHLCCYNIL